MKYYRVKDQYAGSRRYKFHRGGGLEIDGEYVKNELYTARELKKYIGGFTSCDPVTIPKSKIYFFFGARFEIGTTA